MKGSLHVHHLDSDHENNSPENLIVLCANCHYGLHHRAWNVEEIGITVKNLVSHISSDGLIQKQINHLTYNEFQSLLRACDIAYEKSCKTKKYQWIRDRDKVLIKIMWETGARITDILNINTNALQFQNHSITFLVKKHKYRMQFWRSVSTSMELLTTITNYIGKWNVKGLLFPPYRNSEKVMSRATINKKLLELSELVEIRSINPHLFKYGFIMYAQSLDVPTELTSYRMDNSKTERTMLESKNGSKSLEYWL